MSRRRRGVRPWLWAFGSGRPGAPLAGLADSAVRSRHLHPPGDAAVAGLQAHAPRLELRPPRPVWPSTDRAPARHSAGPGQPPCPGSVVGGPRNLDAAKFAADPELVNLIDLTFAWTGPPPCSSPTGRRTPNGPSDAPARPGRRSGATPVAASDLLAGRGGHSRWAARPRRRATRQVA